MAYRRKSSRRSTTRGGYRRTRRTSRVSRGRARSTARRTRVSGRAAREVRIVVQQAAPQLPADLNFLRPAAKPKKARF